MSIKSNTAPGSQQVPCLGVELKCCRLVVARISRKLKVSGQWNRKPNRSKGSGQTERRLFRMPVRRNQHSVTNSICGLVWNDYTACICWPHASNKHHMEVMILVTVSTCTKARPLMHAYMMCNDMQNLRRSCLSERCSWKMFACNTITHLCQGTVDPVDPTVISLHAYPLHFTL